MPNEGMNALGPGNDDYETPAWLFKALDTEFGFTFDGAASERNHLLPLWTGTIETATIDPSHRIYANPPYSEIDLFVIMLLSIPNFSVMLLPSRTGTGWFPAMPDSCN